MFLQLIKSFRQRSANPFFAQRGIFVMATVVMLVLIATLALLGAYQWALTDWLMAVKSIPENAQLIAH